jgi:hypothetical protein
MAHRTVRCSTGHCPVRQPRHQAVGFRPLELWHVGPPGCPVAHRTSPVDCPVCHPRVPCSSARAGAHLMRCRRPLARSSRCSAGSPDSPVNYSGAEIWSWRVQSRSPLEHQTLSGVHRTCPVCTGHVRWIIAKRLWNIPKVRSWASSSLVHRTLSGDAPDTVRWHTRQSGAPDQGSLRLSLAFLVEPISWSFYWLSVNLWHMYSL